MNFAKYILEVFFSRSSALDPGTLYSLAVNEDRRNITLHVTKGYNIARNFISDTLDSHIVAAAMRYFGTDSLGQEAQ